MFGVSRSPSEKRTSNDSAGTGLILDTFHFISAAGRTRGTSVDNLTNQPEVPFRSQEEQQELPSGTINKKASGPQNYRSGTRYCCPTVWTNVLFPYQCISIRPAQRLAGDSEVRSTDGKLTLVFFKRPDQAGSGSRNILSTASAQFSFVSLPGRSWVWPCDSPLFTIRIELRVPISLVGSSAPGTV